MKRRNPGWGCPRSSADLVGFWRRRRQGWCPPCAEPLLSAGIGFRRSFLAYVSRPREDSLWSCDLFRCESATLRTHWVLVVMDQFTRRIIGFGVHSDIVDGVVLCRMFHRAIRGPVCPNTSARITIHCIDSTNGKPIFGYSK
jgi:hypothetical protein